MIKYILFESAIGYTLFERTESEEIGQLSEDFQQAIGDFSKFSRSIKLLSFSPFKNAANALEEINSISEGILSTSLHAFLETNLKQKQKKSSDSFQLGVADKSLATSIKQDLGIDCVADDTVLELMRAIRLHSAKLIKQLGESDMCKAQLGLGHSYSRAKVKFNVNRVDNMIIQAISLVDQIDKDINTFSMRIREWYSWHFPELSKLVTDTEQYARIALIIKNKSLLTEESVPAMSEALGGNDQLATLILDASKSSMGADISDIDLLNIQSFASRVIGLSEYRGKLHAYLKDKMHSVAPNLAALIGDVVGARLISHAGSLTNLSKYPASTVQILGAEKALFRALKTKGRTPKYGIIYHSSFVGKADSKNKGRISRYLANKCSIASRIDCFSEDATDLFGKALKEQVDQRLHFFDSGEPTAKNIDVMQKVSSLLRGKGSDSGEKKTKKRKEAAEADSEKKKSKKTK